MANKSELKREEMIKVFGKDIDSIRVVDGKRYIQVPVKWRGPAGSWHYTTEWQCINDN